MKLFRKKNKVKSNEKANPYTTSLLLAKWEFVKYLAEHDDDDDAWIIFSNIIEDIDLFLDGSVYYCDFDVILKEIAEGYELIK